MDIRNDIYNTLEKAYNNNDILRYAEHEDLRNILFSYVKTKFDIEIGDFEEVFDIWIDENFG